MDPAKKDKVRKYGNTEDSGYEHDTPAPKPAPEIDVSDKKIEAEKAAKVVAEAAGGKHGSKPEQLKKAAVAMSAPPDAPAPNISVPTPAPAPVAGEPPKP